MQLFTRGAFIITQRTLDTITFTNCLLSWHSLISRLIFNRTKLALQLIDNYSLYACAILVGFAWLFETEINISVTPWLLIKLPDNLIIAQSVIFLLAPAQFKPHTAPLNYCLLLDLVYGLQLILVQPDNRHSYMQSSVIHSVRPCIHCRYIAIAFFLQLYGYVSNKCQM